MDSSERDSQLPGSANQMSFVGAFCESTGPTSPAMPTCERSDWPTPNAKNAHAGPDYARADRAGSGGDDLVTFMHKQSMSSSADSPVRTSAMPGNVSVWWKGSDPRSGLNTSESLASFDRGSSSWKTCQGSLFVDSITSLTDWPRSGMTRNGHLYSHPILARHTAARESSSSDSWPTPVKEDSESRTAHGTLTDRVRENWPTPQSYSKGKPENNVPGLTPLDIAARPDLAHLRKDWPTPNTCDANSAGRHTTTTGIMHPGSTLTDAARAGLQDQANNNTSGNHPESSPRPVLNPRWVACLMGFPVDWLDGVAPPSGRSGTRSSRTSRKSSRGE